MPLVGPCTMVPGEPLVTITVLQIPICGSLCLAQDRDLGTEEFIITASGYLAS